MYKISAIRQIDGAVQATKEIKFDSSKAALAAGMRMLKDLVRDGDGDIFTFHKDEEMNTTIIREFTDESVVVVIEPNIITNGEKIGPFWLSQNTFFYGTGEA